MSTSGWEERLLFCPAQALAVSVQAWSTEVVFRLCFLNLMFRSLVRSRRRCSSKAEPEEPFNRGALAKRMIASDTFQNRDCAVTLELLQVG